MSFKPIKYNSGEGRLKIKIEDASGANEGNWTIMMSDLKKWSNMMCKKYGITDKKKKDLDLDWAR